MRQRMCSLFHRLDFLLVLLASLLFVLFPQIDIAASAWLFHPGDSLPAVVGWIYEGTEYAVALWLSLLLFGLLAGTVGISWCQRQRRRWLYLLLLFILGPGLLVNGLLKTFSGRARPAEIAEFGGQKHFTAAWQIADQCDRNCAFVSGHAAAGFAFLLGFFFLATERRRRRMLLLASLLCGGVIGGVRMVQGGHFLSDVVFAFFVVYFSALALHAVLWPAAEIASRPLAINQYKDTS